MQMSIKYKTQLSFFDRFFDKIRLQSQAHTRFIAPKANKFSIDHHDHHIVRPSEDIFLDDDKFANPQITEKCFIETSYVFTLNSLDKKYDHVISAALCNIQAYDSYFNKFNNFSLTFHFLTPKERDLHCSHDVMLRTKQTHTYTYYKFIQHHYTLTTLSRQPHHINQQISSKYTPPFFLNFTYCIKETNLQGILRNYEPINQMHEFCHLNKTFNVDESRPLIVPHEFLQHFSKLSTSLAY